MAPLVSVLVTVYQARPWVRRAVESVLAQTHPCIEVVAVDDGSTDGGREEIADLVAAGRVRLLVQANAGVAAARNAALRASRGAYVVILDGDDWLARDMVARLLPLMDATDPLTFAYCDYRLVTLAGETVPPATYAVRAIRKTLEADLLPALLPVPPLYPNCALLDRRLLERVGGFDPRFSGCDDFDLWVRASCEGARARFLDAALAFHLERPDSQSKNVDRQYALAAAVLDEAARRYPRQIAAGMAAMWPEAARQTAALWGDAQEHLARCTEYARSLEERIAARRRVVARLRRKRGH